jgi:peptide/nickel transport system permease protein
VSGYVLRRVAQSLVVLVGVSVLVFALIHLVPGDPVRLALGTRFDPEAYAALRERSGLDQPLVTQYVAWAGSALVGDLGVSFRSGEPVTALILERLPATVSLAAAAHPNGHSRRPAGVDPAGHAVGPAAAVGRGLDLDGGQPGGHQHP